MDGVLDERQKQCDAGIVFRALNFAHAGRENPSSLARALYCAPRASKAYRRIPNHVKPALHCKEGTAEVHILWPVFEYMDAIDGLCRHGF